MNWLIKTSQQSDNRPKAKMTATHCPLCQGRIWNGQKYDNCPQCGRSTEDLDTDFPARCRDCNANLMTGKVGDCKHFGYDWSPIQVYIDDVTEQL